MSSDTQQIARELFDEPVQPVPTIESVNASQLPLQRYADSASATQK